LPNKKWCSGCSRHKPYTDFHKDSCRPPFFLQSVCIKCRANAYSEQEKKEIAKELLLAALKKLDEE